MEKEFKDLDAKNMLKLLGGIIIIVFIISLIIYLIFMAIGMVNTRSYCLSMGYEYFERIEDKFNCCNSTVRNVLNDGFSVYGKRIKCVAGGNYPAR